MRKLFCVVTICLIITAIFSGCSVLQKLGLQKNQSDKLHPVSSIVMNEDEAKKLTDKVPVHLYFANEDNTKLKLLVRYVSLADAKKPVSTLATTIVKELFNGPGTAAGYNPTLPSGTALHSPVTVNAGIATVDLNAAFRDNHPGGKVAEQLSIFSVVNTLTELKEISKVKFMIEGKTVKVYKGHFLFDKPFPRSEALIVRTAESPAAGSIDSSKGKLGNTGNKKDDKTQSGTKQNSSGGKSNQSSSGNDGSINVNQNLGGADGSAQEVFE